MSGAKRYTGTPITRIAAGGGYDEWIEIADSPSVGDIIEARKGGDDQIEMGLRLLARMIRAWSLIDANGEPLAISYDSLTSLPFALIEPAFAHISKSFLESSSANGT